MDVNYTELSNEIIKLLEETSTIVLATCDGVQISARTMNLVNDGLVIYFQTGKNGEKGKQINENPNVAMAFDNVQIKAIAQFTDNVEEIELCSSKFKAKFPRLYEKYANFSEEPTLICKPVEFKLYKFIEGKLCFDILDIKSNKAYRL
jgi:uncharacterized pyridoxamine 5'-phosphate oxidase family protein